MNKYFDLTIKFLYTFKKVAEEIWVCDDSKITKWEGDILDYKEHLKTRVTKQNKANLKDIR